MFSYKKMISYVFIVNTFAMNVYSSTFFIGAATSSYQIEGWNVGECIWDKYTKEHSLTQVGNATNHYALFKEDVRLMKNLGIRQYRFSISWNRIMPTGHMEINTEGIAFYHSLLDALQEHGIEPYVTLYHWDLPQYLQTNMGGWLNETIISYFLDYSKLMFNEYHTKVKYWMTINEPLTTSTQGYGGVCTFAPGLCSEQNMFLSARYQLLAHAHVAHYYKQNYKEDGGKIGMVINTNWMEPIHEGAKEQAKQAMERMFGWFMDPLFFGTYPSILQSQNPPFTEEEQQLLIHSIDFVGLNHYTTYYIDESGQISTDPDWYPAQSTWLYDAPIGMKRVLYYIRDHYSSTIPIYITESGFSQREDGILDLIRTHYLMGYLHETMECIQNGMASQIQGFFVWSLFDNFEWSSGYNETFGIVHIDWNTFERTPKLSAWVIQRVLSILSNSMNE